MASASASASASNHQIKYISTLVWCCLLLVASCHLLYERHLVPYFRWLHLSSSVAPSSSADDDDKVRASTFATTYYPRDCGGAGAGSSGGGLDVSTSNIYDLILDPTAHNDSRDTEIILRHGAVVLPDLLPSSTASRLRDVIVSMNANQPKNRQFFVLQHANRHSLRMGISDPKLDPDSILPRALGQIASHPTFNRLLVDLLGPNPALVELTAITASFGAASQHWHADTPPYGSAGRFGRTYADIYTMLVFLQDTTASMGATALCPGTQLCTKFSHETCDGLGFQVSPVRAGTAVIYNSELRHRGMAHVDSAAEDRVAVLLSFTSGPEEAGGRKLPMGSTYNLRWDLWGHTLSDLGDLGTRTSSSSWGPRHALGLTLREEDLPSSWRDGSHRRRMVRGWSFPAYVATSCASPDDWDYCTVVDVSDETTVRGLLVAIESVLLVVYVRYILSFRREAATAGAVSETTAGGEGASDVPGDEGGTSGATDGSAAPSPPRPAAKVPSSSTVTTTTTGTVEEERSSSGGRTAPDAAAGEGTTTTTTTKTTQKKTRKRRTVVVTSQTTMYRGGGGKKTTKRTTTTKSYVSTNDDVVVGGGRASVATLSACHACLALVAPLALWVSVRLEWVDDLTPPPLLPLHLDLGGSVSTFASPTGIGGGGGGGGDGAPLPEGSRGLDDVRDVRRDDVLFGLNDEEEDGGGRDFLYAHWCRLDHAHPGNVEFLSTVRELVLASHSLDDDLRGNDDSSAGDDDDDGDGEDDEHRARVSGLARDVLGDGWVRDRRFLELRWRRIVPPTRDGGDGGIHRATATEWVSLDRRSAVARTEAVVAEKLRRLRRGPSLYLSKHHPLPSGVEKAEGDVEGMRVGSSSLPTPSEGGTLTPVAQQEL